MPQTVNNVNMTNPNNNLGFGAEPFKLTYLIASLVKAPKFTLAATSKKKLSSKSVAYIERLKGRSSRVDMNGEPVVAQHMQTSNEFEGALMIISFT